MFQILLLAALPIIAAMLWPDLPSSRGVVTALARFAGKLQAAATMGRAMIGISLALLIFAGFWALQGDAPMFLAMVLPELAGWFATFEIATLVEGMVAIGSAYVALRASGLGSWIKTRSRARRTRRTRPESRNTANDDEPGGLAWAA